MNENFLLIEALQEGFASSIFSKVSKSPIIKKYTERSVEFLAKLIGFATGGLIVGASLTYGTNIAKNKVKNNNMIKKLQKIKKDTSLKLNDLKKGLNSNDPSGFVASKIRSAFSFLLSKLKIIGNTIIRFNVLDPKTKKLIKQFWNNLIKNSKYALYFAASITTVSITLNVLYHAVRKLKNKITKSTVNEIKNDAIRIKNLKK